MATQKTTKKTAKGKAVEVKVKEEVIAVEEPKKAEPTTQTAKEKAKRASKTGAKKSEVTAKVEAEAKAEKPKRTVKKTEKAEVKAEKPKRTVKKTEKAEAKAEKPKRTTKKATAKKAEEVKPIEVAVGDKKRVMFVAAEGLPFIKTGGLADVIGSLPKDLARRGNYDVSVIMPMYSKIDEGMRRNFSFVGNFNVGLSWRNLYCGLYSCRLEGVTYYFIDNEYYFTRDSLYGCYDDGERFAFFSKAVLDSLGFMGYYPDILHCNDWHTAATIIYLKTLYAGKFGFSEIKTVFSIHNIEYQGRYGLDTMADLFGLPEWSRGMIEFDGQINLMKGAIEYCDRLSTVSPTYAEEIKDSYFAHGLEGIVRKNQFKLGGVLNGLDLDLYNPETDSALFKNYSASDMSGKLECKRELQKMLGLPVRDEVPVIAVISRLVSHKGLDLVEAILDELLCEDVQFIVLGKGDVEYENYFNYMESRYNGKCRSLIAFNRDMASKIYSGADIFLMPSKQEPCGLSQMIACRYGTIPVVRKTGGLADSIVAFNDDRKQGNGFAFNNYNAHEMLYVIKDAIFTCGNKPVWNAIVQSAVNSDFSWDRSSREYEAVYDLLTGDNK